MQKIYIYFSEDGDEYKSGAIAELSEVADGDIFAVFSSPDIQKLWGEFERTVYANPHKRHSANTLLGDIMLILEIKREMPFRCCCKLNDNQWSVTERRVVADNAARDIMC